MKTKEKVMANEIKVRLLNEAGIETALAVSVADVTVKVHCDGFAAGRGWCGSSIGKARYFGSLDARARGQAAPK